MISSLHVPVGQAAVEAVNARNMRWSACNFVIAKEIAPIIKDFI